MPKDIDARLWQYDPATATWVKVEDLAKNTVAFKGTCDSDMTASTTVIVSADLAGYGDDYFNTKYWMQIIKNTGTPGAAPEREYNRITDYVSVSGTFTTDAFSANVETTDKILILHESLMANLAIPVASSTNCSTANETDLAAWTAGTVQKIDKVFIDLTAWSADGNIIAGDTMTIRKKVKADAANYIEVFRDVFTEGTSQGAGLELDIGSFEEDTKLTFQSSRAPSAAVAIYYHYARYVME